MELKYKYCVEIRPHISCSNRTFMELKFLFISLLTACLLGSNRTFMELKLSKGRIYASLQKVLIVPLWN